MAARRALFGTPPVGRSGCATPRAGLGGSAPRPPALIAVAHGSRDPRSAATVAEVVGTVAAARPELDVRTAFLDLTAPSVEQVVDAVAAEGHTHAVVTPLLLGSAFHARVDLPGLLATAGARHPGLRLTQADVLGADAGLVGALRDRVLAAGGAEHAAAARRLGVAVAAVGSSSAAANARTAEVATRLAARTGWRTEICFATTEPSVSQAVSRLHACGADHVLVAPWFLAPGLLTDRLAHAAPQATHAGVLGAHPALTQVVLDRYHAAIAETRALSA
ncbi:sirohydrochlorin chelatase [Nocardia gamkensis]|uniref:Sirohydrochlorin chelatase n=1 Tax=Nocardia gamkensis TaxID=352869 RepID=A0A7X6L3H3_9NOCA|nr:CbiX/SirB N-terminal domain-containing protein [Nocardia gamkensis]NKY27072.1 sirohydrochlorin chelatase [Nocardia gamkensis]NQE70966.1 Sirohydrochlorin ferrochelatase [Nocardia gamkensis]